MNSNLPSGVVTFLFTDIKGSTQLWEHHPQAMRGALARHDFLLRQTIEEHRGYVFKTVGDAFCAAFAEAGDALAAALITQGRLQAESWGETPIQVRMALHTGTAEERDDDYFGVPLNRVARLLATGHGGQVLLSAATAERVRDSLPDGVSLRDMGERRLKDLLQPEHIYQLVIANLPADFPPLKTLEVTRSNLPAPLTSFIGREKEMTEVKRLLLPSAGGAEPAGSGRLVTLSGPGGTGKTRLSLQVAADVLSEFADGLWLVELASIANPSLLSQTIAATLGLSDQGNRLYLEVVADYLRSKKVLLILDNCEHLLDEAVRCVEFLLKGCPTLRILVSSREALGVAGERLYRVPSLAIPDPQHLPPLHVLEQYDALRLFVERAISALPDFALTADNAAAAADLCARLDGIPLAIELAAARVNALRVEQIAARLDDRFRLLTGGSRAAMPRQQTLRALIDWSWELLAAGEQAVLRRLSVFTGGWTLAAAEAVCANESEGVGDGQGDRVFTAPIIIQPFDILDLLTHLVNKSLVMVERHPGEEARYRLLETIRQYAREKLVESGEAAATRQQHWVFFSQLAAASERQVQGAGQQAWLYKLDLEHDNLRAALDWSLHQYELFQGTGMVFQGLQMATALWWFWFLRGYLHEGRDWLERLMAHTQDIPASLRARILARNSFLATFQGELKQARALAQEAITLCGESGDKEELAIALFVMGTVGRSLGKVEEAQLAYTESLSLFQELKNDWGIALVMHLLGWMALRRNDLVQAERLGEESLTIRRRLGVPVGVAASLDLLADIARRRGNYDKAADLLTESLSISQTVKSRPISAITLNLLAIVASDLGDMERARKLYEEGIALYQDLGDKEGIAGTLRGLGILARRQGHYEEASHLLEKSMRLRQETEDVIAIAELQQALGDVALAQGDYNEARTLYWDSLVTLNESDGQEDVVADSLQRLSSLALVQKEPEKAARLLGMVATIRQAQVTQLPPSEQVAYQSLLDMLKVQLDEPTLTANWAEGQAAALGREITTYVRNIVSAS
jgi:predicted ATPase/class 3 adenylate cyclase